MPTLKIRNNNNGLEWSWLDKRVRLATLVWKNEIISKRPNSPIVRLYKEWSTSITITLTWKNFLPANIDFDRTQIRKGRLDPKKNRSVSNGTECPRVLVVRPE